MVFSIKCGACGHRFMSSNDDLAVEFDFYEMKISCICRNKKCKHENVFDFADWKKKQKHSPLPGIRTM